MTRYSPLLRIGIKHGYYQDAPARDLEFIPTQTCERLMANAGLILKKDGDRVSLFFDEDHSDALQLYAEDRSTPLIFNFKLVSKNPIFQNFTQLPNFPTGDIGFLSSEKAVQQSGGTYSLTHELGFSTSDSISLTSKEIQAMLSRPEQLIPPLCIVSIYPLAAAEPLVEEKLYELVFAQRRTIWKYYLLGKYADTDLSVVDLDTKISFVQKDDEVLPGGQRARVLETTTPIPLTQVQSRRFQLRRKNGQSSSILVKQLPGASPDQVGIRTDQSNQKEFISEIFINP